MPTKLVVPVPERLQKKNGNAPRDTEVEDEVFAVLIRGRKLSQILRLLGRSLEWLE
jgi:hypothetical protein